LKHSILVLNVVLFAPLPKEMTESSVKPEIFSSGFKAVGFIQWAGLQM
jgi:hypothetical protein